MKIAISQSNYLPWRGYFDLIKSVDEFIFFDEVQFTRRDWRNRNLIRKGNQKKWITLSLQNKGNYNEIISNMNVLDKTWKASHLNILKQCYSKCKYFDEIYYLFESFFSRINTNKLSEINKFIILEICNYLNIKTKLSDSIEFKKLSKNLTASERLLEILIDRGASVYFTGPSAKNYLDEKIFTNNNISINWFNYGKSKIYNQPYSDFFADLSIVDCLMNCGKDSNKFLNY